MGIGLIFKYILLEVHIKTQNAKQNQFIHEVDYMKVFPSADFTANLIILSKDSINIVSDFLVSGVSLGKGVRFVIDGLEEIRDHFFTSDNKVTTDGIVTVFSENQH
jgi:hypothetical protein